MSDLLTMQSEQINDLVTALTKAQGKMNNAKQDKTNPYFKSKYADLASVWDACREVLSENGLCVIQTMMPVNGSTMLVTTLAHNSGQWIRSLVPLNPVKNDPQSFGSCITYMKRYALCAIVGIATEDDDGEKATQPPKEKEKISKEKAESIERYLEDKGDLKKKILSFCGIKKIEDMTEQQSEACKKIIDKEGADKYENA